jgi:ribosome-associated toxin RatA of RatAB toxin-antitoxin module
LWFDGRVDIDSTLLAFALAGSTDSLTGHVCNASEPRGALVEMRKSALVVHSAGQMFDLIEAAEHYAAFLPWCTGAMIIERDETVVVARIAIKYRGIGFSFTTRNPKRRPHWMAIHLEDGPFRQFEGEWRLLELAADACKIEFSLRYEFDHRLVDKLAAPVFNGIAATLIDAFVTRADRTLADAPPPIARGDFPTPGGRS